MSHEYVIDDILEQCCTAARNGIGAVLTSVSNLQVHLRMQHDATEHPSDVSNNTKLVKVLFTLYGCLSGYGDIMSSSERELQEQLDICLGLCGLRTAFLEALHCLKDMSSSASKAPPLQSLLVSLRIIRKILCLPTEENHHDIQGFHFSLEHLIQEYIDYEKGTCRTFWPEHSSISMEENSKTEIDSSISLKTIDDLANLFVLLPVKISTACHKAKIHLPPWAMRERSTSCLIETAAYHTLHLSIDDNRAIAIKHFFSTIVRIIVRHGGSHDVASGLHRFWKRNSSNTMNVSKIHDMMKSLAIPTDCGHLIQAIIRLSVAHIELLPVHGYAKDQDAESTTQEECMPFIKDCCLGILQESDSVRDEFIRIMVLSPSPSCDITEQTAILRCTIHLILSCDGSANRPPVSSSDSYTGCGTILVDSLEKVAYLWCEPRFVRETDENRQWFVSQFILLALNHIQKQSLYEMREQRIIEMLTSGVSTRLATSTVSIRKDGMRVGEKIAALLGQELMFDELDDERDHLGVTDRDAHTINAEENTPNDQTSHKTKVRSKIRIRGKPVDPDEELMSDTDQSNPEDHGDEVDRDIHDKYIDDNSDFGEDDIVPYEIDDDEEDLHEVKKPKYLRDCLEMIRCTGDDYSALCTFEAALEELPILIRANPSDVKFFVEPLTKELLCMQNRFDLDSFGEHRFDGLCALAIREPVLVSRYLCEAVFQDDLIMDMRLDILNVLGYSSSELSGTIELKKQRHSQLIDPGSCKVSGKRKLVPERSKALNNNDNGNQEIIAATLDGMTRRWGQGKRKTESRVVVNVFGPIAAYFFYPLVHGFMQSRGKENLWKGHHGSLLLSQLLICLSTLLKNTFTHPSAIIMAPDLFELSWALHDAEDSSIRKSVLLAMAVSCEYLPEEKIISIRRDRPLLKGFLEMTKTAAIDGDCRRLSSALLNVFGVYSIA